MRLVSVPLTLLVGLRKGIWPVKTAAYAKRSLLEQVEKEHQGGIVEPSSAVKTAVNTEVRSNKNGVRESRACADVYRVYQRPGATQG